VKSFVDRANAGRLLGAHLRARGYDSTAIVLGLPRGGVVVAYEVARALSAPLDIVVVRKVGVPSHPELAMGALGEGGVALREHAVCDSLHISEDDYSRAASGELLELERRVGRYRQRHGALDLLGRNVIVVDDGVATGATARAASASVRARGVSHVTLAVPVAGKQAAAQLARIFDDIETLVTVAGPFSVGSFYDRFEQTSDREVTGYLVRSRHVPVDAQNADLSDNPRRWSRYIRRSP
jgi:putative phosphoribosyl transferase